MQIHLDELNSVQTINIINNSQVYYENYTEAYFFKSKLTNGIKYFYSITECFQFISNIKQWKRSEIGEGLAIDHYH